VRLSRGYDGGVIAVRQLVPVGLNLMARLMELVNQRATFRRPSVNVQCNEIKCGGGVRATILNMIWPPSSTTQPINPTTSPESPSTDKR
jgi:hypothetical protein